MRLSEMIAEEIGQKIKERIIRRLLRKGNNSTIEIADLVEVDVALVKKIRKRVMAEKARRNARKKA
ncbi:MAG TPA: hypothetical protein VNW04_00610 [Puia sp.]|jgi:hypothetical protein|nr:hypothetical protein [Puia sp.]